MCPSYMATREEKHSTRGRAHLLWELMQGGLLKKVGRTKQFTKSSTFAGPARLARQNVV
jgi:Fe-S oxidoreductase